MFDVGFLEILVVLIIALLVIGPQRMPEVARKLGAFMGKTKRFIESVKQEGHLQETVNELKKSMDFQEEKKSIQNFEQELMESMNQPTQEIDLETFSRPSFGGAEPVETSGGSQFSKAPAQPQLPSAETTNSEPTTSSPEQPVVSETEVVTKTESGNTTAPDTVAESGATDKSELKS